jgi:hypothetical protein
LEGLFDFESVGGLEASETVEGVDVVLLEGGGGVEGDNFEVF